MTESSHDLHDVDLKMNSMGKDIEQIDRLCYKLTESIEKLQDVNVSLTKMITLHEEKLDQRIRIEEQTRSDLRDIHMRITNITRELVDKIDKIEIEILEKLNKITENPSSKKIFFDNNNDITKFHWMILGAALFAGWMIGNVNLVELSHLFK